MEIAEVWASSGIFRHLPHQLPPMLSPYAIRGYVNAAEVAEDKPRIVPYNFLYLLYVFI